MTPEQFTYWLKGFFEISDSQELTPTQVLIVKDHLNLVFNKVTPDRKVDLGTYCGQAISYGGEPYYPGLQIQGTGIGDMYSPTGDTKSSWVRPEYLYSC